MIHFDRNRRLVFLAFATALMVVCGCQHLDKLPPGTQLQSSTFGLKFSPGAPDGAPFTLGSHSFIVTTANPPDVGANLNRFEGTAPFGVKVKSTVASGPVGAELEKAAGVLGPMLAPTE